MLESNLAQVTTFSVGQVQVGDQLASYYGTQCLTPDNNGQQVYGGSDLVVVSGDFDALLRCDLDEATRLAVEQARVYDRAARSCFRGLVASRRNYDIARGVDARGRACSGVARAVLAHRRRQRCGNRGAARRCAPTPNGSCTRRPANCMARVRRFHRMPKCCFVVKTAKSVS